MRLIALPRSDWLLIVGGSVLVFVAYPPFHLILPSFLCLVPAVRLIVDAGANPRPIRRRLLQGFWFGFLSQALVLYWMPISLWHFTWAISFGYVATVAILALYTALVFALAGWITGRTTVPLVIVFPVLWTAMEWWVGHQGDIRFPWLGLGTSLTGYPVLVQIADVVGARGVTFLLALANAALALAWLHWPHRRRAMNPVAAVIGGVVVAAGYGWWREATLPVRDVGVVTALQPNVGFDEKWTADPEQIFARAMRQADSAVTADHPDLLVWPEAAVPAYLPQRRDWEAQLASLSAATHTPQLVGSLDIEWGPGRGEYRAYNAAFLFDSLGQTAPYPVYHKQYLVPITEKVPFVPSRWFHLRFFGAFAVGDRGPVFTTGIGRFGVIICYESIFENLARGYRSRGADFLLNITNDAWFGRTSATYQHAAHLTMRAIETRMGIGRAANTGISEFVDPLGRAYHRTGQYVQATATDTLRTSDVVPLYVRLGDWVGLGSVVLAVVLAGWAWRKR